MWLASLTAAPGTSIIDLHTAAAPAHGQQQHSKHMTLLCCCQVQGAGCWLPEKNTCSFAYNGSVCPGPLLAPLQQQCPQVTVGVLYGCAYQCPQPASQCCESLGPAKTIEWHFQPPYLRTQAGSSWTAVDRSCTVPTGQGPPKATHNEVIQSLWTHMKEGPQAIPRVKWTCTFMRFDWFDQT